MSDSPWDTVDHFSPPLGQPRMPPQKKTSSLLLWLGGGLALALLAGSWVLLNRTNGRNKASLEIMPIPDMVVNQRETLQGNVEVRTSAAPRSQVRFSLKHAPAGAQIDPRTGRFVWKSSDSRKPGRYDVTVSAAAEGRSAQRSFRITIIASQESPEKQIARRQSSPPEKPSLVINPPIVRQVPTPPAVQAQAIAKVAQAEYPSPAPVNPKGTVRSTATEPPKAEPSVAEKPAADPGNELLKDLYKKHALLTKSKYPEIRRVFARRFEAEHEDVLRDAFGEPSGAFRKWLDKRPDIKEEFFLALDPANDDVPQALKLFRQLHDRFPDKFEAYANLAIAVSVVWDKQPGAIHESPIGQAVRPEKEMGPLENFQYYVEMEPAMQGRARYLPWEFLVFVVNHRTTLPERKWALLNYLPKAALIGKCFGDVPYDLDSRKGEPQKIKGKLFTLPNQRTYGGVCVCQSDFATRVAKSLGIPAFGPGAPNKFGQGHAWVEWVELGPVTRTGFTFSLKSEGRFFGDKYYVGSTRDPHTGLPATDRQLELRLHVLGQDPLANRQANLVLRAYPMLRDDLHLALPQQLSLLSLLLKFSPGNEETWKTLARLSREGQITKANRQPMQQALDLLFLTFREFPDFTWTVFDDMVAFEDRPLQKADLYARLAGMYEKAGRVDLSCEARLKHAEFLSANGRSSDAIASLAAAIMFFPDEGRYVPRLLDRLEDLCKNDKKMEDQLVRFYQQFLPKIPQKRGEGEPSDYCMAMYKKGIARFQQAGLAQLVKAYEVQLKLLEESTFEQQKHGRPVSAVLDQK
jgi:hypothetical protein